MTLNSKVTPFPRKRSRAIVSWEEFEPHYIELKNATKGSDLEIMQLIGYAGGSHTAMWRKEGVPTIALNAIKWVLYDLNLPIAETPKAQFSQETLGMLFDAVRSSPKLDAHERSDLIKQLAIAISQGG
jgi:hypothetical protein